MTMPRPENPRWFAGSAELDRGLDGFDGCIYEPPDPLYTREGEDPEPFLVADNVPDPDTAARIVTAVNAHETLLEVARRLVAAEDDPLAFGCYLSDNVRRDVLPLAREALALAEAQKQERRR
jgi:hypothetical protein